MGRNEANTSVSHTNSVQQIIESERATWKAILQMQAADDINPDGVFVDDSRYGSIHPQKRAHSYVLAYHNMMANKTYWIKAGDLWQEEIVLENGDAYRVDVPRDSTIELDGGDLSIHNIPTNEEKLTLETLGHRWAFRYVTVERSETGSYGETLNRAERKRVWLPPKAIYKAFEQLEEVRSQIGIAAEIETPGWRSEEPLSLTEEEWDEHRNVADD